LLTSCVQNKEAQDKPKETTEKLIAKVIDKKIPEPIQLPVRYQSPEYLTVNDKVDDTLDNNHEYEITVGANIRSTKGPQPLWDILKRLASLKEMNVSWASDVDQNVLVDVDISAGDNYFRAIDNLLRQVDYYHEVSNSTIIIKYKETKVYHVAMPFTKQLFETATGGNVLGSGDDASSVEGTIRLDSKNNEFDIWKNIKDNLDAIIATWSTTTTAPEIELPAAKEGEKSTENPATVEEPTRQTSTGGNSYTIDKPVGLITVNAPRPLQERISSYLENVKKELYKQVTIEAKIIEVQLSDNSTLGIDWHLLLKSLSFGGSLGFSKNYSKGNTNDTTVLDGFGNTFDYSSKNDRASKSHYERSSSNSNNSSNTQGTAGSTKTSEGITSRADSSTRSADSTVSSLTAITRNSNLSSAAKLVTNIAGSAANAAAGTISLASFNFADFLHALSEQGNTTILSNPKLSVMNGQPALITVGRNVTYVDSVEATVDGTGSDSKTTYTVNTERILSGVGLTLTPVIRDNDEIIMNLVPVTSVLEEPIEYRTVGLGEVGLPIINLREMSSMVKVKDGEMLVIGGLISTVESKSGENLFPGLADVPVLKYLTGYETKKMIKRELIILLRPRIL
jgi:general secretion pathway protein D/MSHA biogenesis protein MshL